MSTARMVGKRAENITESSAEAEIIERLTRVEETQHRVEELLLLLVAPEKPKRKRRQPPHRKVTPQQRQRGEKALEIWGLHAKR